MQKHLAGGRARHLHPGQVEGDPPDAGDLQNSVATGVLLVAVIILFALGFRASLFIGIAIPASFLAGVLGLQLAG